MKRNDLFLYSFTLGISLWVWAIFNQTVGANQLLSIISTIMYFMLYGVFAYFLILKGGNYIDQSIPKIISVGILGIFLFSFGYYAYASFINPTYTANQVSNAQAKWEKMAYTKEAISGQIELTEIFQNPAKWSVQLFGANLVVYLFISFMVLGFKQILFTYQKQNN